MAAARVDISKMAARFVLVAILATVFCVGLSNASIATRTRTARPRPVRLLISSSSLKNIEAYDILSGAYLGPFLKNGTVGIQDFSVDTIVARPGDNYLYLSAYKDNLVTEAKILVYNKYGQFIKRFDSGYRLNWLYGITWDTKGDVLYAACLGTDQVVAYDKFGKFIRVIASGLGIAASVQGPNALVYDKVNGVEYLYVTTEGTSAANKTLGLQFVYDSVLGKINIRTGQFSLIAKPTPAPGGQGYVSLLGVKLLPKGYVGPNPTLIVSDFANDVRYFDAVTYTQTKFIRTAYTASNNVGQLLEYGGAIYVAAFDSDNSGDSGAVLRFNAKTGAAWPAPGKTGAVFIGPDRRLARGIGLARL